MFITREIDYAFRAVRALAGGGKLNIKQICERESIPTEFGYKILKKLSRAGLVTVIRGQGGGYRLSCDPDHTTLLDIASAISDSLFLNECVEHGYDCINNTGDRKCMVNRELCRIQKVLDAELRAHSLTEILQADDQQTPAE